MASSLNAKTLAAIVSTVMRAHPATQAVYLFGSAATGDVLPTSDVDLALLLPHAEAKAVGSLALTALRVDLEHLLGCEVDLFSLREASTVFQKEIVYKGRRLVSTDGYAVAEFEMLVLSYYQKLNEERKELLEAFLETGRAYPL